MQLVANTVARRGKPQAVAGREGTQIPVIIGVFKISLQKIVVRVGNRYFGANPGQAQGFKFQGRHGPGGVLGKRLVNGKAYLLTGEGSSLGQMGGNDFLGQIESHERSNSRLRINLKLTGNHCGKFVIND
jgi:hypothetical protein